MSLYDKIQDKPISLEALASIRTQALKTFPEFREDIANFIARCGNHPTLATVPVIIEELGLCKDSVDYRLNHVRLPDDGEYKRLIEEAKNAGNREQIRALSARRSKRVSDIIKRDKSIRQRSEPGEKRAKLAEFLRQAVSEYATLEQGLLGQHIIDRLELDEYSPDRDRIIMDIEGAMREHLGADDGIFLMVKAHAYLKGFQSKDPRQGTEREVFFKTEIAGHYLKFLGQIAKNEGVSEEWQKVIEETYEQQKEALRANPKPPLDITKEMYASLLSKLSHPAAERFKKAMEPPLKKASHYLETVRGLPD